MRPQPKKTKQTRKGKTISVLLKGSCYAFDTGCNTLKEVMATYPTCAKRAWIADWWYN